MVEKSATLITLNKAAAEPIHLQIYTRFKEAIEGGLLNDGNRVPSTRVLASALNVARGTVESAYSMLLGEGIFVSKGQAGTFVHAPFRPVGKSTSAPVRPPKASSLSHSGPVPVASGPSHVFLPGSPAYDAFPRKIWSRLASRRLRSLSAHDFSYRDPLGYLPLRQSIATYLRLSRGVVCEPQQVFITVGYQGALDFLSRCLSLRGADVWMEDPGYILATRMLEDLGAHLVRVPVDHEGMMVSEGIRMSPQASLAIVTPSHQSPLAMALSWSRRMQLLDWAGSAGAWVIEDDYDGEFRYSGYPLPSLKSLDQYDRVIYAGTFSKTLFPALRLGYLVMPQSLVDICTEKAKLYQLGSSIGPQLVVNDFIAEGRPWSSLVSLACHTRACSAISSRCCADCCKSWARRVASACRRVFTATVSWRQFHGGARKGGLSNECFHSGAFMASLSLPSSSRLVENSWGLCLILCRATRPSTTAMVIKPALRMASTRKG